MKKDVTDLPSDVQAQIRALEALPDDQIDTTDAPEIIDWSDARRGVFYRPVKQQITLRLDADIIAWFKSQARGGRGYQTDINGALREHVQRTTRIADDEMDFTTDQASNTEQKERSRTAKQKANHWIPDNRKGEASKRLGSAQHRHEPEAFLDCGLRRNDGAAFRHTRSFFVVPAHVGTYAGGQLVPVPRFPGLRPSPQ